MNMTKKWNISQAMARRSTFLSRTDEHVGDGVYDSIAWAFEVHVKAPDDKRANFALLYGNEDAPNRIEFWAENDITTAPILIWEASQ